MNHKLLAICALTALAAGLTGCNESVDNGIDCSDGVKKFQCADSKYYSYCDPVTKTEKVGVCDGGFVCSEEVGNPDAPCVDPNALKPESCTNGDLKCDGSFVSRCINQAWIKDDVACQYGCDNGKCNDKPADGCKDGAKQCKGSIPQTCSNGSWTDGANCEYGCENGECKPAPTCNVGDKQCNENNTNVQTCTASGWVDETPSCNYGCENGQCKEPPVEPDCTEEGAKQCADATVQTCTDGQWKNADSACEYGCDKGECKPAPACGDGNVDEGEDCDGGVPEGKTCGDVQPMATGTLACDPTTCKFTGCALPEEGSECDPDTFIESCDGTKVVYCEEGEVVNGGYDCADKAAACVVLDIPGENDTVIKWADCVDESLRCDAPNTSYSGCGTKSSYPYIGQFVCLSGSDGNNYSLEITTEATAVWCGKDEYADAPHCLAETGECGKLIDNEGEACPEDFAPHCTESGISVTCNSQKQIAAAQCKEGTSCVAYEKTEGNLTVECLTPCTKKDEPAYVCYSDNYSDHYLCTEINGALYDIYTGDSRCGHGCDKVTGECIKLIENEGEDCPADFKPSCTESGIAVNCSSTEVVTATECKTGTTCVETEEGAECLKPCTVLDESTSVCVEEDFLGIWTFYTTTTSTCKQFDSGKFMEETETDCNNGCNAEGTGCLLLSEKEGTACEYGTDKRICDGTGVILECTEDNTWSAFSCADGVGEGTECADMGDENGAYCYTPCSTADEEAMLCVSEYYYGSYYYFSVNHVCTPNTDGTAHYYIELTEDDYEYCSAGFCNKESGECADYEVCSEYDSRCSDGKKAVCDEDYYYCVSTCDDPGEISISCSDGIITYSECTSKVSGGGNYVIETRDSCALNCNTEKTDCDENGLLVEGMYKACDDSCSVSSDQLCADYCKTDAPNATDDALCSLDHENYIKCGKSCTEGAADAIICYKTSSVTYQMSAVCTELTNGSSMYIPNTSSRVACTGTCTDGVGCDE